MRLPFAFPPVELHQWRSLDAEGRKLWLGAARDRVFQGPERFAFSKVPGRTVELDGALIDDLLGFYCAIGEAVNGPGGYFGATMKAFDDCLFGGFGLEAPYTIFVNHVPTMSLRRVRHWSRLVPTRRAKSERCSTRSSRRSGACLRGPWGALSR